MPAERSQRIEQLYHAARERNADERAAFLEQACAGDDALRREVESLLAEDSRVQSFLEAPAADLMKTMSRDGSGQRLRGSEPPATAADVTATGTFMTQLGPYKIEARIGQGGMGEVFRAHDTRLRRTVALKVLPRDKMADPERRRRFLQEARAASALNHPNIVTLYDIASESGIDYLVMEYVPGQPLDKRIAPGGLPLAEVHSYATQIASALVAAHSAGIIHRDIKPSNVVVTPESQVKILDFGLAKLEEPAPGPESKMRAVEQTLTETGVVMGTVAYMSPEQARAEEVDARTDLFSFGAVLYEMATGRRAFPKTLDWTTPPIEALEPELGRIVLKLLEADRELRYQTAADVAADLKRLQRAEGLPPSRRWGVAVAALVTLVIAAAAVLYLRPHAPAGRDQWVQLTNFPDSVSQPALSPDGRMLTFIRGPSTFFTPGEIYIKMLPDGAPVQLTRDNISKMSPVFSPDGSRVAYTVRFTEGTPWDTWVVPVLSGGPRPWFANASALVWMNQNNLLFSEYRKFPHLVIVAAEESRARERDVYVPEHDHGMAHRSYPSPDGKWALVVEMDHNGNWVPCRLLPMDGSSTGHRVGPPDAECTFAAWSPDGKWIYLNSKAGGTFHTWRQHFPDGQPEQVTSGPTEEEGIAMAPDGRSFITAVALKQSSVWVHDSNGERQISLEGFAFQPKFTPDGKKLFYRVLKGGSVSSARTERETTELWMTDLESGRTEPFLPGFPIFGERAFDISPDGREAVVSTHDGEGKPRLWVAPVDRRSPPQQIPAVEGDSPMFGPPGEILFHAVEGNSAFAYRVHVDGTGLRKAIEEPVFQMKGASLDGRYLVVFPTSGETAATLAFPLDGGPPVRIASPGHAFLKWSLEGKFLLITPGLLATATKSYLIPLLPGQVLPDFPPEGFAAAAEFGKLPGARVIDYGDVALGPAPDVYAYSRETVQRNLYRIPIP